MALDLRGRIRHILDSAGSSNAGFFAAEWAVSTNDDRFYTITNTTRESYPAFMKKGGTSCNSFAIWVLSQIGGCETLKPNLQFGKLEKFGRAHGCWETRTPDSPYLPQCGDLFNPANAPHHVGFCYEVDADSAVLIDDKLQRVYWTKVEGGQNLGMLDRVLKHRGQLNLPNLLGWFNIEKFLQP